MKKVNSILLSAILAFVVTACGAKSDSSSTSSPEKPDADTVSQDIDDPDTLSDFDEYDIQPVELDDQDAIDRLEIEAELEMQAELGRQAAAKPGYIEEPEITPTFNVDLSDGTKGIRFEISFKAYNLAGKEITATMRLRHDDYHITDCNMVNETYSVTWDCTANPQRLVKGIINIPLSNFKTGKWAATIEASVTFTDESGKEIPAKDDTKTYFKVVNEE